jgi:hypothetical protein
MQKKRRALTEDLACLCCCGRRGVLDARTGHHACECKEFNPALRRWPISPRPSFGKNSKGKKGNDSASYEMVILSRNPALPFHNFVRKPAPDLTVKRALETLDPEQQKRRNAGLKAARTRKLRASQLQIPGC